jgi:hypothetical protein
MTSIRDLVAYSPIVTRPQVTWPGGKQLALWVVPNIEHYEFTPPPAVGRVTWDRVPREPDVREYSFRDYGNRVGLWRMVEAFDDHGVVPTVSLNLAVLDLFPEIRDLIVGRAWCVMSHGIFNTRFLYGMDTEAERAFYADNMAALARHTGARLKGMLTPAITNTPDTSRLMAEAGLTYHADWAHDDQPVPLQVEGARMVSVPYSYELNDAPLWDSRPYSGRYLVDSCISQFDRLLADAERMETGLVMCLALHPYQIGQPQHIGRLHRILEHLCGDDRVWYATGDEIADHYLAHHYDAHVAHARELSEDRRAR